MSENVRIKGASLDLGYHTSESMKLIVWVTVFALVWVSASTQEDNDSSIDQTVLSTEASPKVDSESEEKTKSEEEFSGDAETGADLDAGDEGLPEDNAHGLRAKRQCCGYGGCCGYCRFLPATTPNPNAPTPAPTRTVCYGCCCGCGYGY
ncbi:hypothetical protein L596_021526 [Steinernema carpocapsae]|uniref:Uncharacterized protein n=1 Tax=Steinernema carpocapsae TaxID=34508 RepID=A0A4U5MJU2_STECR|nr:hypothetical protein L596_021526 [Steinernema carpocapsae]